MSSQAALSEAAAPRMLVVADGPGASGVSAVDVFDVLGGLDGAADGGPTVVRVRSAFLFEVGEELTVRIERDGTVTDAVARVRAHVGPADAPITELELGARRSVNG
ncbi:MAG: hypothetical protein KF773_01550 [Deltaproteobacteria bacterium]|nr:hypothetical protein [Deltaproteobacteria bacterium]MCW5806580.1 hypothetical protein [Deltaproteobacteria bacterium]